MTHPRQEIPDPLQHRPLFRSLNGSWRLAIDDETAIQPARRPDRDRPVPPSFHGTVTVPFCPQSRLSGVKLTGHHPVLWYRRDFVLEEEESAGRVVLHFGAVDFFSEVWVNNTYVGSHRGGYTPFSFEVTHAVERGVNRLDLRVEDHLSKSQPRGKQSWQAPFVCWYGECSGIWQSVWLEFAPRQGIARLEAEAQVESLPRGEASQSSVNGRIRLRIVPFSSTAGDISIRVLAQDTEITTVTGRIRYPVSEFDIAIPDVGLWSPEVPTLYDIQATLTSADGEDRVDTYVGFRTVGMEDGMLTLNGEKVYQRLVLNQGIWEDGYYTAPDDDDYRRDIELAQAMGFNGCRMHSKIEDPRFYYWADRLGFLVWEELASPYEFSSVSREQIARDTREMVRRDRGHPSVVVWTLYNESWGVPEIADSREEQDFVRELVDAVRDMDPTRLIVANDGWELVGGDIYGIHSYAATPSDLRDDLSAALPADGDTMISTSAVLPSNGKRIAASSDLTTDKMFILTEFGGIGLATTSRSDAWGYDSMASSPEELRDRFASLIAIAFATPRLAGFVYTQLTDVEQEVNGLLRSDRTPKFPIDTIRKIVAG